MKNRFTFFCFALAAFCLAAMPVAFVGCGTPARTAYAVDSGEADAVTTVMKAWGDYVRTHQVSIDTQRQVKAAYLKVRAANLALVDATQAAFAVSDMTSTNAAAVQAAKASAQAAADNAQTDLFNLLATFNLKP